MLKQIVLPSVLVLISYFSIAQEVEQTQAAETDSSATADSGYIVDNLFIYAHSGPSKNYRIVGSIDAGTQIRIISQPQDGYIQIVDDKDREVWVEEKFVTLQAGLKQQLNEASESLVILKSDLKDAQAQLPVLQQNNNDLRNENALLQKSIADLQTQLSEQQQKSLQKKQSEQHKLLAYGGGIAFSGLLLGVLLTVFLSRRKRYDGWA